MLLFSTTVHFFGDMRGLSSSIGDPRNPKKITYPAVDLALAVILMFVCGLGARRQIAVLLRNCMGADTLRGFFRAGNRPTGTP